MAKTMKKKEEFEFCAVCKLNHDQGRRHNFFPNHKKSLSSFLSRFQSKLSDVRYFLKNPSLLRPEHASRNRLWCVFCDSDIDEVGSSFAWWVIPQYSYSFRLFAVWLMKKRQNDEKTNFNLVHFIEFKENDWIVETMICLSISILYSVVTCYRSLLGTDFDYLPFGCWENVIRAKKNNLT